MRSRLENTHFSLEKFTSMSVEFTLCFLVDSDEPFQFLRAKITEKIIKFRERSVSSQKEEIEEVSSKWHEVSSNLHSLCQ